MATSLSPKALRTAKIIGGVLGFAIAMVLFVALPMAANYADHGSIFVRQETPKGSRP